MKVLKITTISIVSLIIVFFLMVRLINFYPDEIQEEKVICTQEAPSIIKLQSLKVLSWNVQYMAGKNYIFFYDAVDGPDIRPSSKDIAITTKRVADVIKNENPDIILLQEIDDGADRTDDKNQTIDLLKELPQNIYPCYAEAFYWKSAFVPHPKVMGSTGMKLVTLSKYKIEKAYRHSLEEIPNSWIEKQFQLKRGILETRLPYQDDSSTQLNVMNTHLSAFAQGTNALEKQVEEIIQILTSLDNKQITWLIGGDFNLLPAKVQRDRLPPQTREAYKEETELKPLIEKYQSLPSLKEATGENMQGWFTHSPNSKIKYKFPDRTIDYIFFSNDIEVAAKYVRTANTLDISDHMPLVATISLKQQE